MELLSKEEIDQSESQYSFTKLVEKCSPPVYKFCRSLTYSKEDADDLFQETFLSAFEQQTKLLQSDNPQSFLFCITLYLWKSIKRKYARRNKIAPFEPVQDNVISTLNTENDFIKQEEIDMVRHLVTLLPEKYKVPILLYYTIDLSVGEIAKVMKIPVGTVKSRLFKARKIIEKELEDTQHEK